MSGEVRGRTTITATAMQRIVRAVTAEQLDVDARSVHAELTDEAGRLAVAVRTPIRVVSIERYQQDPTALDRLGGSVLERAQQAERRIAARFGELTGSVVDRVSVRLTAARIGTERRVR